MKIKKKLTTKDIVELMMIESYSEILRFQKLIDEWSDPKDIAQRAAVLIKNIHQRYAGLAYMIYHDVVKKK